MRDPRLPEGVQDYGPLQRRVWAAQRVSWVVFGLILLACLFGLLGGDGLFSRGNADFAEGSIVYPKLARWNSPEQMEVTFRPADTDQMVLVDSGFFDAFSIEGIEPPQKNTFVKRGMTAYVFASDPQAPRKIVFELKTRSPWLNRVVLGIAEETRPVSSFIYP